MVCNDDGISLDASAQQVSQMCAVLLGPAQAKLLVEVTIVQITAPVDADQIPTHDLLEIGRREVLFQESYIVAELALGDQRAPKTLDRHIGQGIEVIECHPEMFEQLPAVVLFEGGLGRRQRRSERVINQIKCQTAPRLPVTQGVQLT